MTNEQRKATAARLTLLREAMNMTASGLCRDTGFKPNRWSQYESGARLITLDAAILLCRRYGATLDWIYRGNVAGLPMDLARRVNCPITAAARPREMIEA